MDLLKEKNHTQSFFFLNGLYQIDFGTKIHRIAFSPKKPPSLSYSMSQPEKALDLYKRLKKDIHNYIKENYNFKI